MIDIHCNYCDTPAKIKGQYIYMMCHCCDDRRIINLKDHTEYDQHNEYLYSRISDEFINNVIHT